MEWIRTVAFRSLAKLGDERTGSAPNRQSQGGRAYDGEEEASDSLCDRVSIPGEVEALDVRGEPIPDLGRRQPVLLEGVRVGTMSVPGTA